jgi:hypothetical protein
LCPLDVGRVSLHPREVESDAWQALRAGASVSASADYQAASVAIGIERPVEFGLDPGRSGG